MSDYGTAANVRTLTGATATGLGFKTDGELIPFIQSRLAVASDYIRRDRMRVFEDEAGGVPAVIHDIAERMAANYIRAMLNLRNHSITEVSGEDEAREMEEPGYFTKAIKDDLRRVPRGAPLHLWVA